jgi:putative acetyltransferase
MIIRQDDLSGIEIARLLDEHLQEMALLSPPESVHALDLEALKQPDVTFWCAWLGDELAGCGALKELDQEHAEIKSMRTALSCRGQGVARKILEHILKHAGERSYRRLSLETGSMDAFEPARRLYSNYGFEYCPPFSDYVEDPYSVFMTREL